MIQRPPSHICQRSYLDYPPIHVPLNFLRLQHIIQRVVEWTQIREDLFLEIPWQEPQCLPCLNSRAGQDNSFNLFFPQGVNTHRHCKVRFPCSCRTYAEYDIETLDCLNIIQLLIALWNDWSPTRRCQNFAAG